MGWGGWGGCGMGWGGASVGLLDVLSSPLTLILYVLSQWVVPALLKQCFSGRIIIKVSAHQGHVQAPLQLCVSRRGIKLVHI